MDKPVVISDQFDGGNIECVSCDRADNIRLNIKPDAGDAFYQWFYFRLTGSAGQRYTLNIENAGTSSYPDGWKNYRVVASYDQTEWFRTETDYRDGVLSFSIEAQSDVIWFACFAPYSLQQHNALISQCATDERVSVEVLGKTHDGRDIDLLSIGDKNKPVRIWAIARQHPGETMAEWWMEGYLDRLLDEHDSVSRALLEKAVFYVVPNMNPDGSFRGYLRTNARGINLNREWDKTTIENSPEVFHVLNKMRETGISLNLDVHGDEALPYNFIAGTEGIESWTEERKDLQELFKSNLMAINPDFQTTIGYPISPPKSANYGICSSFIAENFSCPAMTLEMPFKDTVDSPNENYGWSDERSAKLGSSCVDAIYSIVDKL